MLFLVDFLSQWLIFLLLAWTPRSIIWCTLVAWLMTKMVLCKTTTHDDMLQSRLAFYIGVLIANGYIQQETVYYIYTSGDNNMQRCKDITLSVSPKACIHIITLTLSLLTFNIALLSFWRGMVISLELKFVSKLLWALYIGIYIQASISHYTRIYVVTSRHVKKIAEKYSTASVSKIKKNSLPTYS